MKIVNQLLVVKQQGGGENVFIPMVKNLALSEWGILSFDAPDLTDYKENDPTLRYIITVNGTTVTTSETEINVFDYLVNLENNISVVAEASLKFDSNNKEETIMYSKPAYTNIADFTLQSTTVDGETGYKVTAYNGSNTIINIPPNNTDGLPILQCDSLNASEITGVYIKKIGNFKGNKSITKVNFPNSDKTTNFYEVFSGCTNLTEVHALNTSNAVSISNIFSACSNLTSIPLLDTSKCTNMQAAFIYCSSLKTIPAMDTSKCTNMQATFMQCSSLETIPAMDASNVSVIDGLSNIFGACTSLKSILMYGMKASFDISSSTRFERSDLVTILNNLATITTSETLTMGETNLAKLTEEDKAIATNKGWTLA